MNLAISADPIKFNPAKGSAIATSPWRRARADRPAHRPTTARLNWRAQALGAQTTVQPNTQPTVSPADVEQAITIAVATALSAERQRMAADLHDDLGGALAVLAQRSTDAQLAAVARTALSNMRGLLRGCGDDSASFADCCADMRAEIAQLCELSGVQLEWVVDGNCNHARPNPSARLHAQRVLRESTTNALRHSRCTRLTVTWQVIDGSLALTVADNGCGFDATNLAPSPCGHGLGLSAMHTRAHRLGGSITLSSEPGVGTRLACSLPC